MSGSVIVADNDMLIRSVIRSMLAGVGQTVFLAATGEEAVAFASSVPARLILLDLNMPRLNGLQACEAIRRLPDHADTPIIILTAYDGEQERRAAELIGATGFIRKPFQPVALLQSLAGYLDIDPRALEQVARAAGRARAIAGADAEPEPARPAARPDGRAASPASSMLDEGRAIIGVCHRVESTVAAARSDAEA